MAPFHLVLGKIKDRIPGRAEILAVFNVVVFVVYRWAVRNFLYGLPSFLFYYRTDELIAIFFFGMALALLESLLLAGMLVLTSVVLPSAWFRQGFAYQGFLAVAVGAIAAAALRNYLGSSFPPLGPVFEALLAALAAWVLLSVLFSQAAAWRRLLLAVVDRFSVFSYIYVPLGLIGLVVLLVRNLF